MQISLLKAHQFTSSALIYNYQIQKLGLQNKFPYIQEGDKIKFIKLVAAIHLSLM